MAGRDARTARQRLKPRRERRAEWKGDWATWTPRLNADPHGYRILAWALLCFVLWFGFVVGCTVGVAL